MIYHILDELIYSNSRYELMTLLEDVYPTKQGKLKSCQAFAVLANSYEKLLDDYFPALPLSEERLAIFLRVYSESGFIPTALIQAFESGHRPVIFSILRSVEIGENQHYIPLMCRRFYEATIFGDE